VTSVGESTKTARSKRIRTSTWAAIGVFVAALSVYILVRPPYVVVYVGPRGEVVSTPTTLVPKQPTTDSVPVSTTTTAPSTSTSTTTSPSTTNNSSQGTTTTTNPFGLPSSTTSTSSTSSTTTTVP
jgi:hypothetical protein